MILKDLSFETPEENILFDEVLLDLAERGEADETLRFWESQKLFVVLGRTSNPADDINMDVVCDQKIPILRRSSGGGTVVQGKGCLNYSLILSKELNPAIATLRKSYEFILGKIIQSLANLGITATFKSTSDIAVGEMKFSGNAQKRGRKFILHHGTILYDFDLFCIERYLRIPRDIPQYRRGRSHLEFLTNIPASSFELKGAISKAFHVILKENALTDKEHERLSYFLRTKEVTIDLKELLSASN